MGEHHEQSASPCSHDRSRRGRGPGTRIAHLATAAGATPSTLINTHGTMAGGTLKKGADSGTPSISHLDFEALDAAVPDAFALCAG